MNTTLVSKRGVSVPSYLSYFETEFDKVNLVYAKKLSLTSDNGTYTPSKSIKEETIDECDLTGDPLKIDLGEDDFIHIDKIEQIDYNWSNEEARHYPLTVKEARRKLNSILKNPKPDPESLPIYVVCNGDDEFNTVLLGADRNTLMICGVHTLGFIELKDDEIETDKMIEDHYNRCDRKDIKNLELVAGHKLLRLNFLWEELNTLQSYLDILTECNFSVNEETILCKDPLDSDTILQNISRLIKTKFVSHQPKKDILDLDNLRNEDFLDGLWSILKDCENISVLRNSFHFLFEELSDTTARSIHIEDKYSSIALILNGILQNNVVLPAITFSQCVELLFELAAQKLKFDFQVILDHFCNTSKDHIESIWKTFYQTDEIKKDSNVRATRVTQFLNAGDLVVKSRQLAYLSQLYVASEFIYLVKEQVYLQEESFNSLCQHLRERYVEKSNVFEEFLEICQSPLCETSCELIITNTEIINSLSPSRWTMYMTSEVNSSEVTTIYDLSETSIFPPAIYNHDIPISNKNMVYYMSKVNRKKEVTKK